MSMQAALMRAEILRKTDSGYPVQFLKPIDSVTLAALCASDSGLGSKVQFGSEAKNYASTIGLTNQLQGKYSAPGGTGLQGHRYSALTRLSFHHEVEACNKIIADLIYQQLGGYPQCVLSGIVRVVGELHDNVASHSSGTGFSCAQVFKKTNATQLEIAVADNGVGIPRNVRKMQSSLSDAASLEWAVKRGNTSARSIDDGWAQRLPEDSIVNPFPKGVCVRSKENNHMGEGLWQLSEIVRTLQGELRIASGNGQLFQNQGSISSRDASYNWSGVVISFTLNVQDAHVTDPAHLAKLESLAARLQVFQ